MSTSVLLVSCVLLAVASAAPSPLKAADPVDQRNSDCFSICFGSAGTPKCYKEPFDIGCFGNQGDFCRFGKYTPQDPSKINMTALFYSTDAPSDGQPITYYNNVLGSIGGLKADFSKDLTFVVHGFNGAPNKWQESVKNHLMPYDTNVVLIYWPNGASGSLSGEIYCQPASNTRVVGAMMGAIYMQMQKDHSAISPAKTNCVGHSLGGHICGFMGNFIQEKTGQQLGRIIGLDAAGPLFEKDPTSSRLDKTDAAFVQDIHSNNKEFGQSPSQGHVDFQPNGGNSQPGCNIITDVSCSHSRSHDMFDAWLVCDKDPSCVKFLSWQCSGNDIVHSLDDLHCFNPTGNTCTKFGYSLTAADSCAGTYYFATTDGKDGSPAYFGSQYALELELDHSISTTLYADARFYFNGLAQDWDASSFYDGSEVSVSKGIMPFKVVVSPVDKISSATRFIANGVGVKTYNAITHTKYKVLSLAVTCSNGIRHNITINEVFEANKEYKFPFPHC